MSERWPPSVWSFSGIELPDEDAVIGGGDLAPGTVLAAYREGFFPMPLDGHLAWWSPAERGVLGPEDLKVSRSLRRSIPRFKVTLNESFTAVIDACADPRRPGGWITPAIRDAYVELHRLGWAHSVEVWNLTGELVGGLYGVSLGRLFCGESMFHHETDASKVALVHLVSLFADDEDWLIDTQWVTPHLATLGVRPIARREYVTKIKHLISRKSPFDG